MTRHKVREHLVPNLMVGKGKEKQYISAFSPFLFALALALTNSLNACQLLGDDAIVTECLTYAMTFSDITNGQLDKEVIQLNGKACVPGHRTRWRVLCLMLASRCSITHMPLHFVLGRIGPTVHSFTYPWDHKLDPSLCKMKNKRV